MLTVWIKDPQARETCNYFSQGLVSPEKYSEIVVGRHPWKVINCSQRIISVQWCRKTE